MRPGFRIKLYYSALLILLLGAVVLPTRGQSDDGFGDNDADPVRLFERAQSFHAKGDLAKAIEYYERAIKVRPEFPEAEFQRGNALASLGKLAEAETAFKQAITEKPNWTMPLVALGTLLVRQDKDSEAETIFRKALRIDAHDNAALRLLAEIRLRAGDKKEALELAHQAAADKDAPAAAFIVLARAERANGNLAGATSGLDKILGDDPNNVPALLERADINTDAKKYDQALVDLKAAERLKPGDKVVLGRMAFVYQQAGQPEAAQRAAQAAGIEVATSQGSTKGGVNGTPAEIEAANDPDPNVARKALEVLLTKNPRNPTLLARLGASYRKDDPSKSLEYYKQAAEVQPDSAEYAIGYASALVQTRRFTTAAEILHQVIRRNPDNYSAHANLATALYEMKQYAEAIPEYQWLLTAKPDVVVAYYFIATAHDFLGEYPEALSSYETFLARADATTNQLEIDKVNLRLPTLRRQIKLGEGVKKKP